VVGVPVAAVTVERDGPVTTVRLSRPHARTAVDGVTAEALADAFRAFDADPDAAVAVLHGEGGTFCAGTDLRAVGTPAGNRTEPAGDGPMGPTRLRLRKPVIAALAGHAVAGGLGLALWCDDGTVRLPLLIGASRAVDALPGAARFAAGEGRHGQGL
jgi:enoyl-CoA hydratase